MRGLPKIRRAGIPTSDATRRVILEALPTGGATPANHVLQADEHLGRSAPSVARR
jgi:hypothetical protein